MTTEAQSSSDGFYGGSEALAELPDGTPLAKPVTHDLGGGTGAEVTEDASAPDKARPGYATIGTKGGRPERSRDNSRRLRFAGSKLPEAAILGAAFSDRADPTAISPDMAIAADLHDPLSNQPARNGVGVTTNNRPSRYGRFSI